MYKFISYTYFILESTIFILCCRNPKEVVKTTRAFTKVEVVVEAEAEAVVVVAVADAEVAEVEALPAWLRPSLHGQSLLQ